MTDETTPVAPATPETKPQEPTAPAIEAVDQADPAPAGIPEEAAASDDDPGDETADEGKPRKKGGGFQKRISELTREKYEEQIRADTLRRENEELRQKLNPTPPSEPGDEPKLEGGKYATLEEWQKAHADWTKRNTEWAKTEGYRQAQQEREQREQEQKTQSVKAAMQAREAEARRKYPDFDLAVAPVAPLIMTSPVLKLYAAESEHAMDVAYHLAKHPEKLVEISKMTPFAAARELTRLEERVTAPPPKTVTKAPDPIKPVGQSEKAPFSPETASMEEYSKWRAEQRRKHKG